MRSLISGSASILTISRCSSAMMSFGVPAGTMKANQCADDPPFLSLNWEGPTPAKIILLGKPQPRLPQRVIQNVRRDDGASSVHGQAAGERVATDFETVHALRVTLAHAGNMVQLGPVPIDHIEAASDAVIPLLGGSAGKDAKRNVKRRPSDCGLKCLHLSGGPELVRTQRHFGLS